MSDKSVWYLVCEIPLCRWKKKKKIDPGMVHSIFVELKVEGRSRRTTDSRKRTTTRSKPRGHRQVYTVPYLSGSSSRDVPTILNYVCMGGRRGTGNPPCWPSVHRRWLSIKEWVRFHGHRVSSSTVGNSR